MKFKKLRNEKSSLPVKEWGDLLPFKTGLELNPKSSHSQTGFAGLFNSGGVTLCVLLAFGPCFSLV
jgi:hypothetical protein